MADSPTTQALSGYFGNVGSAAENALGRGLSSLVSPASADQDYTTNFYMNKDSDFRQGLDKWTNPFGLLHMGIKRGYGMLNQPVPQAFDFATPGWNEPTYMTDQQLYDEGLPMEGRALNDVLMRQQYPPEYVQEMEDIRDRLDKQKGFFQTTPIMDLGTEESQEPGWWREANRRAVNVFKDPLGTISRLPLQGVSEGISNVAEDVFNWGGVLPLPSLKDMLNPAPEPINLGQTHEDTLQSFFDIPEEPTGSLIPVSTGDPYTESGKVVIDEGVQTDYTPKLEPLFDIESLLADDHIDTTPVYDPTADAYLDTLNESFNPNLANIIYDSGISGDLTPVQEAFDDYVEKNVLGVDVPSTSEIEAQAARDEQKRIAEIEAREEEERARLQKIIDDNRARRESDERQAREARERADRIEREARERDEQIKADDRKAIARANAEAEEKERQAKEKEAEEQRAREILQIEELAAASDKLAREKEERDKEAGRQQLKELQEFMAAARERNIAAENRLRSTMGGTNYAAYLRRGK